MCDKRLSAALGTPLRGISSLNTEVRLENNAGEDLKSRWKTLEVQRPSLIMLLSGVPGTEDCSFNVAGQAGSVQKVSYGS